jgi:C_GCAxxG_C_C family probable redox protein
MGETCGALLGGIMTIGLVRGREDLADFDAYVETMKMGAEMFNRFREKIGNVKCFDIQEKLLGRHFNFFEEEDREAWYNKGGIEVCPWVCGEAARIAADIILPRT